MKRLLILIFCWPLAAISVQGQSVSQDIPQKPITPSVQDSSQISAAQAAQRRQEYELAQAKLLEKLDQRYGFRDVDFGTHLKFFKHMVLEWQEDDDRNYHRLTDKLSINGMPLTEIVYGFYKKRLHHIYLTAPGIENSRQMLRFFQSIYGMGERVYEETEEFDNMIQWTGKKVILTYSEVASKKEGFFHFFVIDSEMPQKQLRPNPKRAITSK